MKDLLLSAPASLVAMEPLTKVNLKGVLPLVTSGKVREVYEVNETSLLLVCTDRVSAFDRVIGVWFLSSLIQ